MTTQLNLYNGALLHLGERRLASLSENNEPRRVLDEIWQQDTIHQCLEQALWRFARRTAKLVYDPAIEPEFGYARVFVKPDDYVRTAALSGDEFFSYPLENYRDEAGYIFASIDELYLTYISDDTQYGGDLSLWTSNFTRYVEVYLAYRACKRITGDDKLEEKLEERTRHYLRNAAAKDAMNDPTLPVTQGSWSRARSMGYSRRDRGSRSNLIG